MYKNVNLKSDQIVSAPFDKATGSFEIFGRVFYGIAAIACSNIRSDPLVKSLTEPSEWINTIAAIARVQN